MLARPAKHKLVKLAKACFPPGREPNSRSGAVTTVTLAIQVAAQIGGYLSAHCLPTAPVRDSLGVEGGRPGHGLVLHGARRGGSADRYR
jgi:hypothetical protein